jgi:4-alpha-glucanotransferase
VTNRSFSARSSGILLHPTSLPGPHGIGDLGPAAHRFAEFLKASGQSWWQMLPVGPTGAGNSPYDSPSSFAGSSALISLELLERDRLLKKREIEAPPRLAGAARAEYRAASRFKEPLLRLAGQRFRNGASSRERARFERFRTEQESWLDDYALFSALKTVEKGRAWVEWDAELRKRSPRALARARESLREELEHHEFVQWIFHRQWLELKTHCNELGVRLLGDVPMFVAHDGADVWSHPEIFHLDRHGQPSVVAGVPPDAFSKTGQLWGNPVYRWNVLERTGYRWWIDRFRVTLRRFDALRLDHFIGFRRYWEVPARAKTALRGRYVKVPGDDFLRKLRRALGGLPFIAEDLGVVTDEVHALRDRFELPGMRVLQFAFSDPNGSDYLPHRHDKNSAVYSGTHDNDTTVGWYRARPSSSERRAALAHRAERARVRAYLGSDGRDIAWDVIRAALMSVANTALFPLQDLLSLGSSARMNTPGTRSGNWSWRVPASALQPAVAERMAELCRLYDRV